MTCTITGIDSATDKAPALMKVWSWRQAILRASLESTTKLVLLALSTYMNDHGNGCYPSQEQIARDTSLTERAVRKHIALAIESGFLIKTKRNLKGKKWDSNEYEAAMPLPVFTKTREEPYSAHEQIRGEPRSGEGGTIFQDGRNHVPTNSSENSSINPKELSPSCKKSYPDDFEHFWILWPSSRRCEKPLAYKAWREACKKIPDNVLMEALKRYVVTKEVSDGFAPYPAKWLRRQRWLEFMQTPDTSLPTLTIDDIGDDTPENKEWGAILHSLQGMHGEAVYRSWFRQLRLGELQGSVLTLRAPSRFVAQWLQSHYGLDITRAVQNVWPDINQVRIEFSAANIGNNIGNL